MCQEISDLREGQLLALCRQPGVGAVIYLLFGAASVEVSMENALESNLPALQSSCGRGAGKEGLEGGRFQRVVCPCQDPQIPQDGQCESPAPTEN